MHGCKTFLDPDTNLIEKVNAHLDQGSVSRIKSIGFGPDPVFVIVYKI